MLRSRAVSLTLVGLFAVSVACSSYRPVELSDVPNHEKVRLTMEDGGTAEYYQPTIEGDSIRGLSSREGETTYSVALDRVAAIEEGGTEPAKTFFLGLGLVAGGIVVGAVAYCVASSDEYC